MTHKIVTITPEIRGIQVPDGQYCVDTMDKCEYVKFKDEKYYCRICHKYLTRSLFSPPEKTSSCLNAKETEYKEVKITVVTSKDITVPTGLFCMTHEYSCEVCDRRNEPPSCPIHNKKLERGHRTVKKCPDCLIKTR